MGKPYCTRCLLEELSDETIFETVKRTIASIPKEQKAEEGIYKERLQTCLGCEKLVQGMCKTCGCFVEVRAVYAKKHCPAVHPLW